MDAGALANILKRPVTPAEEGGRPLASLNLKLAIAVVAAQGGRGELLRELQALAGRYPTLRLVQAPGAPARLEAGAIRFSIPAVLRDALLAAAATAAGRAGTPAVPNPTSAPGSPLASAAQAAPAATPAGTTVATSAATPAATQAVTGAAARAAASPNVALPANAAGPAAAPVEALPSLAAAALRAAMQWPAALAAQSTAARPRGESAGAPAARWPLPLAAALLDERPDPPATAARLQAAVRDSGLFAEAQLARSLARERAGEAAATVARDALRAAVEAPPAQRAAAQLDMLRRDCASFVMQAWSGQSMQLDLGREPLDADGRSSGAGDSARVFVATLRLALPQSGAVTVTLRLANATVAAQVEAADPQQWEAALPDLAARLLARGLHPAALRAVASAAEEEADVGAP